MGNETRLAEQAQRRLRIDAAKEHLTQKALKRARRLNGLMRVVETPICLNSRVEALAARELESEGWATLCGLTCWFLVKPGSSP